MSGILPKTALYINEELTMILVIAFLLSVVAVTAINTALYIIGRAWQWIQAARFEHWLETH